MLQYNFKFSNNSFSKSSFSNQKNHIQGTIRLFQPCCSRDQETHFHNTRHLHSMRNLRYAFKNKLGKLLHEGYLYYSYWSIREAGSLSEKTWGKFPGAQFGTRVDFNKKRQSQQTLPDLMLPIMPFFSPLPAFCLLFEGDRSIRCTHTWEAYFFILIFTKLFLWK